MENYYQIELIYDGTWNVIVDNELYYKGKYDECVEVYNRLLTTETEENYE